ncbi:MAG: ATP-binding protein [Candidatus Jordarchaeum sp.]|uniref:ATP-binding protein n=1 Tax=Candidatus Jordarchaeum sp. TaxID=2823881 RepID=UPI00404B44CC
MSEDKVYSELQKHLDKMPIGYPATQSGVELRVLKFIFTPEQAKIATKLNWEYEPLETIYNRFDKSEISVEELKEKLDDMAKKGCIHYKIVEGERHYANAFIAIGMYEYQLKRLTKEFQEDFEQYISEAFALEFLRTGVNQLRIIPIEQSLTAKSYVSTYDDLRKIIEKEDGPFCVSECICRKAAEMKGQPCSVTSESETCMALGPLGQLYIDNRWGRQVSKKEALEILRKNEEAGLVHQPSNAQRPEFICSCCGCCCLLLSRLKQFPNPAELIHTNYQAQIDPELCTGCETCVERCQMNALTIVENVSTVNLIRCIGCGNCVPTCPSEAIRLRKKEEEIIPPKTVEELYKKIKSIKNQMI